MCLSQGVRGVDRFLGLGITCCETVIVEMLAYPHEELNGLLALGLFENIPEATDAPFGHGGMSGVFSGTGSGLEKIRYDMVFSICSTALSKCFAVPVRVIRSARQRASPAMLARRLILSSFMTSRAAPISCARWVRWSIVVVDQGGQSLPCQRRFKTDTLGVNRLGYCRGWLM